MPTVLKLTFRESRLLNKSKEIMAQALPHSSKPQMQSFFSRKMEAYRSFGRAATRPQANFHEYLLDKRRLNLGYVQRANSNLETIRRFRLRTDDLLETPVTFPPNPGPINSQMFTIITTDVEFNIMYEHLKTVKELTLDLEGNMDHSYYGK